jgi:hypothetical protein
MHMPNSLRLTSAYAGIPAASQVSSRLTFGSIVTGGYGAAVVYGEYLEQDPEIIRWTYYQDTYNGFYVYCYTQKASDLRIPTWTSNNGQDDLLWYVPSAQTNVVRGQTYNWALYVQRVNHKNEIGNTSTTFMPNNVWNLKATICDVKNNTWTTFFGSSYGNRFEDFEIYDGYPECDYGTSFSVYFPADDVYDYTRYSIWLEDNPETKFVLDEYAFNVNWLDVDLTPDPIERDRESYTVCAKADQLNSSGEVVQEGVTVYFYIPIKPTVIGSGVTIKSITGDVSAYAESYCIFCFFQAIRKQSFYFAGRSQP